MYKKLKKDGLQISCWEGLSPPPGNQLWLIDYVDLINVFRQGKLKSKQLIFLLNQKAISSQDRLFILGVYNHY